VKKANKPGYADGLISSSTGNVAFRERPGSPGTANITHIAAAKTEIPQTAEHELYQVA